MEAKIETYRINDHVRAPQVRLITHTGENAGVVSRDEALQRARMNELDLVEIAPLSQPPVCKIIDFKKFLFQKRREERKAIKGSRKTELKEFRFGPYIGDHDLMVKVNRATEFLKSNHKVKFTVKFRGRQNAHPEVGMERLERVKSELAEIAKVESEPTRQGNFLSMTLMRG